MWWFEYAWPGEVWTWRKCATVGAGFKTLLLGADPVPQLSIPKFLKRTGLPGVLTYRRAGRTSHSQRQQEQLIPEITRWGEARART